MQSTANWVDIFSQNTGSGLKLGNSHCMYHTAGVLATGLQDQTTTGEVNCGGIFNSNVLKVHRFK